MFSDSSSSCVAPGPDDEVAIARLVVCGAAQHPGVGEPPRLRERLAACIALGVRDLESRAADLYLAAACVAGDPAAIARLDEILPRVIGPTLARFRVPVSDRDEIVQRVRIALLVRSESGSCALAGYSGRGDLRGYMGSVAARTALRQLARTSPAGSADDDVLAWLPASDDSPELALLKQRCRADLRAGFASAVAALTPRERTLLRQHYVDGLTIDLLSPLHQVHRATCARWIEAARLKILRGVREYLRATLGLDDADLQGVVAMVRSQLELSLSRQLASCAR